ncbi:MAG: anti-sigma factor antagonist [Actinomycetia bacterium]|nr:anti-sigma factor antagonist [Actinomycetes bacterium]
MATTQLDADRWTLVHLRGEIDLATAPALDRELTTLRDRGAQRLWLDLAEVTFLDASGVRVLCRTAGALDAAGGGLELVGPRGMVRRVLEITGLGGLIAF